MNDIVQHLFIVFILFVSVQLSACSPQDRTGNDNHVSNEAAAAYVQQEGLVNTVSEAHLTTAFSPPMTVVAGKNASGDDAVIFLRGSNSNIHIVRSVLLKDGVTTEQVLAALAERGADKSQVQAVHLVPLEPNGQTAWMVELKGEAKQQHWFDFRTGNYLGQSDKYRSLQPAS